MFYQNAALKIAGCARGGYTHAHRPGGARVSLPSTRSCGAMPAGHIMAHGQLPWRSACVGMGITSERASRARVAKIKMWRQATARGRGLLSRIEKKGSQFPYDIASAAA